MQMERLKRPGSDRPRGDRPRGNPLMRKGAPSVNPSGRSALTTDQRAAFELMKIDAPANVEWMIRTRNDPKAPWEIRARIATHLDNRVHGQPAQALAVAHMGARVNIITAPTIDLEAIRDD